MRVYDIVFERGGLTSLIGLAACPGLVLILSMPWAGRVADFFRFPWRPTPLAFLISVVTFAAAHAINRGGTVELLPRLQRRQLLSLPFQVLIAQVLIIPYIVSSAVLTSSGHVSSLWHVWGYTFVLDLSLAVASFHTARWCIRRGMATFFPLVGLVTAIVGVPLALGLVVRPLRAIALLSPPYAVFRMATTGLGVGDAWLVFLVPGILAVIAFVAGLRMNDRGGVYA